VGNGHGTCSCGSCVDADRSMLSSGRCIVLSQIPHAATVSCVKRDRDPASVSHFGDWSLVVLLVQVARHPVEQANGAVQIGGGGRRRPVREIAQEAAETGRQRARDLGAD